MLIHASMIRKFMQIFPALNSYNFTILNPRRTVKGTFPELCSFRSDQKIINYHRIILSQFNETFDDLCYTV